MIKPLFSVGEPRKLTLIEMVDIRILVKSTHPVLRIPEKYAGKTQDRTGSMA
jgi:hypothetical protein